MPASAAAKEETAHSFAKSQLKAIVERIEREGRVEPHGGHHGRSA